jgi:hypothetical protein
MNEVESYTQNMRGRYRMRTWLREHAPRQLTRLFPKGARDCRSHVWYRQDEQADACYHCDPGARPDEPLNLPVDLEFRAGFTESAAQGNKAAAAALAQLEVSDSWYWTPEWQAGEREVDEEIARGESGQVYESGEALLASLDE